MLNNQNSLISCVVVAYFPDVAITAELLRKLSPQVEKIFLVDNGGAQIALVETLLPENLEWLIPVENIGLGAALNRGFERAHEYGYKYVLTFDQDSVIEGGYVKKILHSMNEQKLCTPQCAAISPVFYDYRSETKKYYPIYRARKYWVKAQYPNAHDILEADTLITSGMLVDLSVWANGNKYDEDLFVDYTDTEWCFRVRCQGYKLFATSMVEMGHALSDGAPISFLGFRFLRYSPKRRYIYFRNTMFLLRSKSVPLAWKIRLSLGAMLRIPVNILIDSNAKQSFLAMMRGIIAGSKGILGPV